MAGEERVEREEREERGERREAREERQERLRDTVEGHHRVLLQTAGAGEKTSERGPGTISFGC